MLNSLWGRFGMNTNRTKIKIIRTHKEWLEMITDNRYNIISFQEYSPNLKQVFYNENSILQEGCNTTNVVLAAFVTCYARLKLLNELLKLGDRVLYYDTDSIVFILSKENEYEPPLGDYLGKLTDELDGEYIEEFVSLGPKNYAMMLSNKKTKCVIKGLSLNYIASTKVNFEEMKKIVLKDIYKKLHIPQFTILRDKKKWELISKSIEKEYGCVYDKRILLDDFRTIPFGYIS